MKQISVYFLLCIDIDFQYPSSGVEIMSPHYFAKCDGSASTIPEDYLKSE